MSTPSDDGNAELRYAEYVLGVLEAQEREELEREMARSEAVASAVQRWRQQLLALAEEAQPEAPPADLWQRIRDELQLADGPRVRPPVERAGIWDSVRFWHRFGLLTGVLLAAACVAIVTLLLRRPEPPAIAYMASTITEKGGQVGWTATMDIKGARMIIVPASPHRMSAGRSAELWLIPQGGRPIPVGVISSTSPITIPLAPALLAQLGPTASLAVSVEPRGGSPTGQPTGPVIAQGAIGAAAAGTGAQGASTAGSILLPNFAYV